MKALYILMTIVNRISLLGLLFSVVLSIVFIPLADDPMPAVKFLSMVAVISAVLFGLSRVLVKKSKQSILAQMEKQKTQKTSS